VSASVGPGSGEGASVGSGSAPGDGAGANAGPTPTGAPAVVVETSLDDLRSDDVRFLEEAAALGPLHVRVPSDALLVALTGVAPKFPAAERLFLAESLRFVARADTVDAPLADALGALGGLGAAGSIVAARAEDVDAGLLAAARRASVPVHLVTAADRDGFRVPDPVDPPPGPRVVVTGCYDWLHSGHIRFFLDAAAYGALYVVVGSNRNVELLKGPGHPLRPETERRYMVGAVKTVHHCCISSGSGWMDAEPEIDWIRPTHYVVNEDGDQPEKRAFCAARGIEYVVLQRMPHAGLPARSSTSLRGF
jgi:cytidyltransferase-like protein